jgi:hypothetical protein
MKGRSNEVTKGRGKFSKALWARDLADSLGGPAILSVTGLGTGRGGRVGETRLPALDPKAVRGR